MMTIRSVTETVPSTVMCEQSPWSPGMELDPRLLLLSRRSLLLLRCLFSYYLVLILCNTLYWCWPLPDTHITFGPQIWFCCSGSNCLGPSGCQPCQECRWHHGNSTGCYCLLLAIFFTVYNKQHTKKSHGTMGIRKVTFNGNLFPVKIKQQQMFRVSHD